jgi:hypothetical protein
MHTYNALRSRSCPLLLFLIPLLLLPAHSTSQYSPFYFHNLVLCSLPQLPQIGEELQCLPLWDWLISPGIMTSSSINFLGSDICHTSLWLSETTLCVYTTFSLSIHLLIDTEIDSMWQFEQCHNKQEFAGISAISWLWHCRIYIQMWCD